MDNRLKDDELKKVVGGTGENEEDKCPNDPEGKHCWVEKRGIIKRGEVDYYCTNCFKTKTEVTRFRWD